MKSKEFMSLVESINDVLFENTIKGTKKRDGPFTVVVIKNNKTIDQFQNAEYKELADVVAYMKAANPNTKISVESKKGKVVHVVESLDINETHMEGEEVIVFGKKGVVVKEVGSDGDTENDEIYQVKFEDGSVKNVPAQDMEMQSDKREPSENEAEDIANESFETNERAGENVSEGIKRAMRMNPNNPKHLKKMERELLRNTTREISAGEKVRAAHQRVHDHEVGDRTTGGAGEERARRHRVGVQSGSRNLAQQGQQLYNRLRNAGAEPPDVGYKPSVEWQKRERKSQLPKPTKRRSFYKLSDSYEPKKSIQNIPDAVNLIRQFDMSGEGIDIPAINNEKWGTAGFTKEEMNPDFRQILKDKLRRRMEVRNRRNINQNEKEKILNRRMQNEGFKRGDYVVGRRGNHEGQEYVVHTDHPSEPHMTVRIPREKGKDRIVRVTRSNFNKVSRGYKSRRFPGPVPRSPENK